MTDRELLEAAARAAGITLVPYTWNKGTGWDHEGFTVAGEGPEEWSPLESDGDALRLAVALKLDVSHLRPCGACADAEDRRVSSGYVSDNDNGGNHARSVRRAIVRAAAAMVDK